MEIETLRLKLLSDRVVFRHARVEAEKDGLDELDLREAILVGQIVESYEPERRRCLVAGVTSEGIPVHLVVDYTDERRVKIVTVYVPDRDKWAGYTKRAR